MHLKHISGWKRGWGGWKALIYFSRPAADAYEKDIFNRTGKTEKRERERENQKWEIGSWQADDIIIKWGCENALLQIPQKYKFVFLHTKNELAYPLIAHTSGVLVFLWLFFQCC